MRKSNTLDRIRNGDDLTPANWAIENEILVG